MRCACSSARPRERVTASLPQAHGAPVLSARIRVAPEDFRVDEIDGFEADGSGEHLLLKVEKRGMNTAFAAKLLAQWAGIDESGIGYAGLKDRHAVTVQRFTVHLPGREAPGIGLLEAHEGLRVLAASRHSRKMPRGALAGNRFALRLREASGDAAAVEARLQAIAARGVPNYFGEQRFGREGDNIPNALAMFAGRRVARAQRTHLLSAARSQLFNRVLASRVEAGTWDAALDGEVWLLDGSRSVFGPLPFDDALAARLASFDIHPSAPLWGRGELRSTGAAAKLERDALADAESLALRDGLESAGLKQERRATRLQPRELSWEWLEPETLELRFSLPPGAYATAVLAELTGGA